MFWVPDPPPPLQPPAPSAISLRPRPDTTILVQRPAVRAVHRRHPQWPRVVDHRQTAVARSRGHQCPCHRAFCFCSALDPPPPPLKSPLLCLTGAARCGGGGGPPLERSGLRTGWGLGRKAPAGGGGVGLAASCRSRLSGVGLLPCPTTRLNYLTLRFQGRADYRQSPDPTEAQVGGRYRRPVCGRELQGGRAGGGGGF